MPTYNRRPHCEAPDYGLESTRQFNNNPWGKKPARGGGDLDQAFKDWQKRIESLFGGGGGGGVRPRHY